MSTAGQLLVRHHPPTHPPTHPFNKLANPPSTCPTRPSRWCGVRKKSSRPTFPRLVWRKPLSERHGHRTNHPWLSPRPHGSLWRGGEVPILRLWQHADVFRWVGGLGSQWDAFFLLFNHPPTSSSRCERFFGEQQGHLQCLCAGRTSGLVR